ncbi:hypothetical protein WCLP8_1950004 [uncultured Gammaproteobacteria bacterium]
MPEADADSVPASMPDSFTQFETHREPQRFGGGEFRPSPPQDGGGDDSDDILARLSAAVAVGPGSASTSTFAVASGPGASGPGASGSGGWRSRLPRLPSLVQVLAWGRSPKVLSGVGLALVMVMLVVFRGPVVSAWPPSARLFEAIGFPAEPLGFGLRIQNVHAERRMEDGAVVLVIDGQVINISQTEREVPQLRASLLGTDGGMLRNWRVKASQARLAPGAIAVFQVHESSPGAAAKVVVTFDGG